LLTVDNHTLLLLLLEKLLHFKDVSKFLLSQFLPFHVALNGFGASALQNILQNFIGSKH
jgi:hypothetical protein